MKSERAVSQTGWAGWIGGLVLFLAAFAGNIWHDNFPIFYHYDEPAKVEQVVSGNFRLNQPVLMLEATSAAVKISGKLDQPQAVGEIGRWLSAVYAAAAVTILAGLAWRIGGKRAAIFAALLLLAQRQIILAGHYFKEDALLLLGLAAAWAALFAFLEGPSGRRAVILGAACALALSAKFIGALMLIPAGLAIAFESGIAAETRKQSRRVAKFLTALLVVAAALNLRALLHPGIFVAGFSGQWDAVEHGNHGVGGSLPNWRNFGACFLEVTPVTLLLNMIFIIRLFRKGGSLRLWLLAFFPAGFACALLFSAITAVRYSLPVAAFAAVVAALALNQLFVDARKILPARRQLCLLACMALAGITVAWELWRGAEVWSGFGHDSRKDLAQFITNMPNPPTCVAQDSLVQMGQLPALAVPAKVLSTNYAADLGTVEELRREGVTHVAICWLTYRRYFEDSKVAQREAQMNYARRKQFYEEVIREGNRIFSEPMGRPDILQPGLELYDIRTTAPSAR